MNHRSRTWYRYTDAYDIDGDSIQEKKRENLYQSEGNQIEQSDICCQS